MLQSSGLITFGDINTEMFYPATQLITLNDTPIRNLANKPSGIISLSDFYGKANRIPVTLTIAATTTDYVLNPSKVSGYLAGLTDVTFVINSGVVIGSTSTGSAGLSISGFTAGDSVNVINNGYIVGRGGNGGSGNGGGGSGGLALSVSYPTKITNNGIIGGGGGGGGGSSNYSNTSGPTCTRTTSYYGGSGGGGGAGYIAGSGGGGANYNGNVGAAGSAGSLTAGGGGASSGGGLGSAGGSSSYGGGAAGACTSGNSYITWLATGSLYGALN